jgi:hypothetical protein
MRYAIRPLRDGPITFSQRLSQVLCLFRKGGMALEAGLMIIDGVRPHLLQLPEQAWTHGSTVQRHFPVFELACMTGAA